MSSLASRLRDIVGSGPAKAGPHLDEDDSRGGRLEPAHHLAETLGGSWAENQRFLVVDRSYGPGYRHGRIPIMDSMPPWPRLSLLHAGDVRGSGDSRREELRIPASSDARGRLLFIDLETTGLAGGAGTYAFLVGCGWFDGPTFRVRQLFLSTYAGERALLDGLAHLADGISGVVSFNGKSFDLPLIETRYLLHRLDTPFAGVPHIDMLHPARRLWRADADDAAGINASCRLSLLEQTLCGVARDGDVPSFEIPARYFRYVRTGDPRPLERVFEHNRLDLISLALLTARASQLLEEGPIAARTVREALGLGRLYERGGLFDRACEAYAVAAGIGPAKAGPHENKNDVVGAGFSRPACATTSVVVSEHVVTRAEALRSYAVLCRRQRRFFDAACAWRRILELRRCPPHIAREATEALAVHHEHRLRDPRSARQFALQSLRFEGSISRQHAVQHRLARLERKLAAPTTDTLHLPFLILDS